jgi:quinol monooxygenase YgiN
MTSYVAVPLPDSDLNEEIVEMQFVLIVHEVESYPAWKIIFDRAAGIRKAAGEISYQLLRYDNEQNTIVHFSQWTSLINARSFFESPALQAIRCEAGVIAPNFIYLNEIEHKNL